ISSALGESNDKTQMAISGAIPGLLAGLDRTASTGDGAERISSAVNNVDDSILGTLTGMFGKGYSSDTGSSESLRSILGSGGLSELSNNVGRISGLSGKNAASIIGILAPLVLGVIKQLMRTSGLDISSLLAGQRANIAAAMPRGMAEETYSGP